jgi:hypothetical protein
MEGARRRGEGTQVDDADEGAEAIEAEGSHVVQYS